MTEFTGQVPQKPDNKVGKKLSRRDFLKAAGLFSTAFLVACKTPWLLTETPISTSPPPEPTKTSTPRPDTTPTFQPNPDVNIDISLPSPYSGFYFGQEKTTPGTIFVGAIKGASFEANNSGYSIPQFDGVHESRLNYLYSQDNPDQTAGFLIDSNYLMQVFKAEDTKGGVIGTLPDGTSVEYKNGLWQATIDGKIKFFNPLFAGQKGKPFGYPVLADDNQGNFYTGQCFDENGVLVAGTKMEPAFKTAGQIAWEAGYSGDLTKVGSVELNDWGNIVVYDTLGNQISVQPFLNPKAPAESFETPSVPMIEVGGLKIPDPKASNPELFDLTSPDSPIVQFANAFGVKPEEVGNLTPQLLTGVDGKQFVVLTTGDLAATANFDESGRPIIIWENGAWQIVTIKAFSRALGIPIGVEVVDYPESRTFYKNQVDVGLIPSVWGWDAARNGVNGNIDFSHEDHQYNFAANIGYANNNLIFNNIIFPANTPEGFESFNRQQAIDWMNNYIKTVMSHYKGKIKYYVVVNEPHGDDILQKIIGSDYIQIAYQTAREANPDAFLIFNETDNHGPEGKFVQNTASIGNDLYAKGLIDAIGVQGHLAYGDDGGPYAAPTEEQILNTLNLYTAPIILTEVDANLQGVTENRLATQNEWYTRLISAAIKTNRLKGIFFFGGFPDHNSWYELAQNIQNADPTLWDDNFNPKQAYYGVLKSLLLGFASYR